MGSSSSKSSSSTRVRFFQSSCIGSSSGSRCDEHQVSHHKAEVNVSEVQCAGENKSGMDHGKEKQYKTFENVDEMAHLSANLQLHECGQPSLSDTLSRGRSSSSRAFSSRSLNASTRFLSRLNFFPDNMSFRLSRASTLKSSRGYHEYSESAAVSNDQELHPHSHSSNGLDNLVNRNSRPQGCEVFPACLIRHPRVQHDDVSSPSLRLNRTSVIPSNLSDSQVASIQELACNIDRVNGDEHVCSPRNFPAADASEVRLSGRPTEAREPVEGNVRFSRNRSVGRLRDRVRSRSPYTDFVPCPLQQVGQVLEASETVGSSQRRALVGGAALQASTENLVQQSSSYSLPSISNSLRENQDFEMETTRFREGRYHELLEHTSSFLERRRRIRSQVRALQRMGSRFENLSGHERSCIVSGQYRSGSCTCRLNGRSGNSNDGATASISRIVLLAEALFEVLDEIHQQSVVLSSQSQPSLFSNGSVPAPHEVVDSLPLKWYRKHPKLLDEEEAQCYICLVEYEDGDGIRVLPCHHEFHRSCIDRWLKEIHRICPLCRGDICRADSLTGEN